MNKTEHLKYHLEVLMSCEPIDLDYPEFEVAYEDEIWAECFATVCCIENAARALDRIKELEKGLGELMSIASQCDSWESFPSGALEDAAEILKGE